MARPTPPDRVRRGGCGRAGSGDPGHHQQPGQSCRDVGVGGNQPPLAWHAELGRSPCDTDTAVDGRAHDPPVRAGSGMFDTVSGYGVASLSHRRSEMENGVLRTIAHLDGTPFPCPTQPARRRPRGRTPRPSGRGPGETGDGPRGTASRAAAVATTGRSAGQSTGRRPGGHHPGWCPRGGGCAPARGARLGDGIAVWVPAR